jgi:hypothetical protein
MKEDQLIKQLIMCCFCFTCAGQVQGAVHGTYVTKVLFFCLTSPGNANNTDVRLHHTGYTKRRIIDRKGHVTIDRLCMHAYLMFVV